MALLGLVRASYLVVDTYWVGHLGTDALTAVSVVAFGWWMVHHLCELPATGLHARVAQLVGEDRAEDVGSLVREAVWLALLVAGVVWLVVWASTEAYLTSMGVEPDSQVAVLGASYLGTLGAGGLAFACHGVVGGVFRGVGHVRTALWVTAAAGVLNAILDPLLIWGVGPIPALGVAGAGWATVVATAVAGVAGAGWAHRARWLTPREPLVHERWRMAVIGAPITLMGIGFALVYVVLGRMVMEHGSEHMAALGVGHRVESYPFLVAMGFSVATTTLVGQRWGAGDLDAVRRGARTSAWMCMACMMVFSVGALWAPGVIYGLFSDDPLVVASGVVYIRCQAISWMLMGCEAVFEGAFTGAGRTIPAMWIGGILTAARIPLAWALAVPLGWGILGIWLAIAITTALKGLVFWLWFERMLSVPGYSGS